MKLYVFFTPEELSLSKKFLPTPNTVVVLDILRATTTITTAIELGARYVKVFPSVSALRDELEHLLLRYRREDIFCLGERDGKMIEGFDEGNSPVKLFNVNIKDKIVLMTTTNGTRAISLVSNVREVICGCLRNRMAICDYLFNKGKEVVFILCSGWKGGFSLEDSFGAGAIIEGLSILGVDIQLANDQAMCSRQLYRDYLEDPSYLLKNCCHGKRLLAIGCKEDISFCSSLDKSFYVAVKKTSLRFEALKVT